MADKVSNTNTLSILAEFVDGDNRTINLENPNTAINLAAQVVNLGNYLQTSQVIAIRPVRTSLASKPLSSSTKPLPNSIWATNH